MMAATPRPWKMENFDDATGVAEINSDPADGGKWSAICSVESNTLGSRPVSKAEAEANGRLIVRSVNLHDELVESLATTARVLAEAREPADGETALLLDEIDNLLARAKEQRT